MDKPFAAYQGSEPYLFVCYAHDDAEVVYPEIGWLHHQGVRIWYDEGISPGSEFPEALGRAVAGAKLLLFYVSPRSVASRHCRDEVYYALENGVPVLAVHLAPTELSAGMALSLGTSQALLRHQLEPADYRRRLLSTLTDPDAGGAAAQDAEAIREPAHEPRRRRRLTLAAAVVLVLSLAAFGVRELVGYLQHQQDVHWVRYEAIPQIKALLEMEWRDYTEPYALAETAARILPDDPEVVELLARTSLLVDVETDPPGADVYVKAYAQPEAPWRHLGTTPLADQRLAVSFFRWRLEKPGFAPVEAVHSSWNLGFDGPLLKPNNLHRRLTPADELPDGMVRVAGGQTPFGVVPDFFIDRFEVTNRQYKAFMDAGGYDNGDLWQEEFRDQGVVLTRAEAMAELVDQSGRPGPSTWLGGTYPDGTADHPVSGVSWFEAAAYARFVGRELPTSVHWGLARGDESTLIQFPQLGGLGVIAPFSNFNRRGTVAVGSLGGVTTWGAYDLAGNVAEWCSNVTAQGRTIRGGSYGDNTYEFAEPANAPPMMRPPGYGFRTALLGEGVPQAVYEQNPIRLITVPEPEAPVSDAVFAAYRERFEYDHTPFNVEIEGRLTTAEDWAEERVVIDAAYDGERLPVVLFLPAAATPPFQTVVYWPGSGSVYTPSSADLVHYYEFPVFLSFLVKSGRAVVYPIYKGTFERTEERLVPLHYGSDSHEYTEYLVRVVKDFRRTLDYLETREDIDADAFAYYGMSWGGLMGSIVPAVEERLKTSVLLAAGLSNGRGVANPYHYLPRIHTPTLMLVGRYDTMLGYEASALPLYEHLGTPPADKVIRVYETDHLPPKRAFVTEILAWLDRYLGEPR
ncbi:MAG: SUMF1/EgtB/PvdO family nonheme iron enzyme [Pseudomonadales bacterium]